ncbi:MAG: DUF1045 domain-containing protein [Paracoccus sp. (in: a-proteobacteria)]|nr:DUF1045 domain-containing protein [Paracoccus sp. (in: a-proteobacteria)]
MPPYRRFAIYYTPPKGAFADAASAWLGWDAARGEPVAHPPAPMDVAAITATPRKYGIHATIKAPFRPTTDQDGLRAALRDWARGRAPVVLDGLDLTVIDGFIALIPATPSAALQDLAASAVRDLDHLRAPLTEAEIARRRPERLDARERELLDRWGYPYVMEQFQFHMTLSGPLSDPAPVMGWLADNLVPLIPRPFTIDAMTLCGEAEDGRFHELDRIPLGP